MKSIKLLFPHKFQPVGYVLWAIGLALFALNYFWEVDFSFNDILSLLGKPAHMWPEVASSSAFTSGTGLMFTLAGILVVLGSLFAGFSRFRVEDEYFETIRMESMLVSFYLYAAYLLGILIFSWGLSFLALAVYGCFGAMSFYVVVLAVRIILAKKEATDEE